MKNFLYLYLLLLLVTSCKQVGLKMTVEGKVINHITGEPIDGVPIQLDGINPNPLCNNCWEHAAVATTDANGEFYFEERTKAGWDYHCEILNDEDTHGVKYWPEYSVDDEDGFSNYSRTLDKYKDNTVELRVVPQGYLTLYVDNIQYQSVNDSITFSIWNSVSEYTMEPITKTGDYHSNRVPNYPGIAMPMGPVRIDWIVQRMGIKQVYSDSIYLQAGEKRVYEIKY